MASLSKIADVLIIAFGLALTPLIFLYSVRAGQLSSHHVVRVLSGHVLSDYWTTNNFEVVTVKQQIGTNFVNVQKTNQLWTVWSIWK